MDLWQQVILAALMLFIAYRAFTGIGGAMEKSKNAEEKHWGTFILIVLAIIVFIVFLISTLQ